MTRTSLRSLGVLAGVALVCAILVSVASISLRSIQERNEFLQRYRHVIALTGQVEDGAGDDAILEAAESLDARVFDVASGEFAPDADPNSIDSRSALANPELSSALPTDGDLASLGRRANEEVVFLVWTDDELSRIILPISGQGMWSTLYGYIALENDLSTIAAVRFYEQGETAGLGDQIEDPLWQSQWQGRRLYDDRGGVRFRLAGGAVNPGDAAAAFEVDGLTGATITGTAVTNLVRFWFGPDGYGPLLARLSEEPPTP